MLAQLQALKNWEVREAGITHGLDLGQKHVGSRQGLGPAQVSRQEILSELVRRGVRPEEIVNAAKQPVKTVPIEQLKEGDTFVDKTGEPRRIVEITPRGKIRTADGTALTFQGGIEIRGELNSTRAQLARGGKFIEEPERPAGSTVPLVMQPRPTTGLSTLDVAKELNRYTRSEVGSLSLAKASPEEMVGRGRELAIDEAKYQLTQKNAGTEWYKKDIAKHDQLMPQVRAALADPTKLSIFKFAEAIMSLSREPYPNVKLTLPVWDYYQENGVFNPVNPRTGKSWGPAAKASYGNAFRVMNNLIDKYKEAGAVEWLLTEHPTSELREYNPNVPGEADEMQYGAMALGDKRGPFALNLHGMEAAFTADRWVSRTWNRWMGTIQWSKEGKMLTDAPRGPTERSLMKQAFSEAAEALGLTTSQLQAVLWYYEQSLYTAMGVAKRSGSFAAAAARVLAEEKAATPSPSAPSRLPARTFSAPSRQPRAAPLR
ncbi:MAG TPA: hypothetical protein VF772_04525 [Terriglobales bacterium]